MKNNGLTRGFECQNTARMSWNTPVKVVKGS